MPPCLVVGDFGVVKWGVAVNPVIQGTSHDTPISDVVYNEPFNLVISADESSTVRVWDAITGKAVYFFTEAHGRSKITALALDNLGRRLVTGAQDGSVKVWNFSTGVCLQNCIPTANAEVAGVIYARDPLLKGVVAGGWSRRITLWPDEADDTREGVDAQLEMEGQQDDILCIALSPPHSVASGSYDGTIVIHNILSGITKHTFRIGGLERLPVNERAVEKLEFLQKKVGSPLLSYHADGKLRLWNVSRANAQVVAEVDGRLPVVEPDAKLQDVTAMTVDPENHRLFCGDAAGWVAVRDIRRLDATNPGSYRTLVVTQQWHAHKDQKAVQITSLAYAANWGALISASVDTSLKMWSGDGQLIGCFGSKDHWNLRGVDEPQEEEGQDSFFITGTAVEEKEKKKAEEEEESRPKKGGGKDKLPAIASAIPRDKPKDVDRVKVADSVVKDWLETKRYNTTTIPRLHSKHLCDKDGGSRLDQIVQTHVPYLQRHSRDNAPFTEMSVYGKFKQLEAARAEEAEETKRRR